MLSVKACVLALALTLVIVVAYVWPRYEYATIRDGVAIVDGFYSSSPSFTDETVAYLSSKELNVTVYMDSEVTVDLYRRLPTHGYSIIILRVHAGVYEKNPTKPTFLFTNERYTESGYPWLKMSGQVAGGKVNPDNFNESSVFTVGPLFVAMSMERSFNGSIIILSSCLGLYTLELAEAFIDKGAKAFISWDEKVSLLHTDEACMLLLKALIEDGMTINQSVEKVMREVGSDPEYGGVLMYYPEEVGNLKLEP